MGMEVSANAPTVAKLDLVFLPQMTTTTVSSLKGKTNEDGTE